MPSMYVYNKYIYILTHTHPYTVTKSTTHTETNCFEGRPNVWEDIILQL